MIEDTDIAPIERETCISQTKRWRKTLDENGKKVCEKCGWDQEAKAYCHEYFSTLA